MLKRLGFLAIALIALLVFVPAPRAQAGWGFGVQIAPAYPAYPPAYAYPGAGYYGYPDYPPPAYYAPGYVYPYVYGGGGYYGGYYGHRGYERGYYGHDYYRGHEGGFRGYSGARGHEGYRGGGHRR